MSTPGFETGSKSFTKEISDAAATQTLCPGTEHGVTGNQLVVDADSLGPH